MEKPKVNIRVIKISVKGQIVIPIEFRKKLDIRESEPMLMAEGKDFVIIKKIDLGNHSKKYLELMNQALNLNTIQQPLTI